MSGYYSDFLFHFTGKKRNGETEEVAQERGFKILVDILENGFLLNFNEESLDCKESFPEGYKFGVVTPIVCFTDIPLDKIGNHVNNYGKFGIGVSKDWATNKGAQPVIYIDKNNMGFSKGLRRLFELTGENTALKFSMVYIFPLLKNIQFYEEREWRILYDTDQSNGDGYYSFERDDIKVVVAPKAYIKEVHNKIRDIFKKKYGDEDIPFAIIPFEDIEKLTGK